MSEKFSNVEKKIDDVKIGIERVNENTIIVSKKLDEITELRYAVDRLTASIGKLQNPDEYLDIIKQDLEAIKNYIPKMEEQINEVLCELYSPVSTTQKLKIAIPIIPSIASYELETDVPRVIADKIDELKNLVLSFKNK